MSFRFYTKKKDSPYQRDFRTVSNHGTKADIIKWELNLKKLGFHFFCDGGLKCQYLLKHSKAFVCTDIKAIYIPKSLKENVLLLHLT